MEQRGREMIKRKRKKRNNKKSWKLEEAEWRMRVKGEADKAELAAGAEESEQRKQK